MRLLESERVEAWAALEGFQLCGIASAEPLTDSQRFQTWVEAGYAGEMRYLTDHRADLRRDPRSLLASAQTIICVGMLYNTAHSHTHQGRKEAGHGWISRYAWGDDYHSIMRNRLERLAGRMQEQWGEFEYRVCVDTAPLLERSLARQAGLGWIGKNTCLINQEHGSWFFLGELLISLSIAPNLPPPDRCGSCRRCIDACPTGAIVPGADGHWTIDARQCISYLTIEKRGDIPEEQRSGIGVHVFGCDICQDVCPWNRRAPVDAIGEYQPRDQLAAPDLAWLANLSEDEFRVRFRASAVVRAKYRGFLRNVAIAMGNSAQEKFRPALDRLAHWEDPVVADCARWALARLEEPSRRQRTKDEESN